MTLLAALLGTLLVAPVVTTDSTGSWPLRPRPDVVSGFDRPESAWGPGHRGVDLVGHPGQPVRSALDGTVSFAGTIAGRPVVVVDHGPTRTTYEPVSTALSPGDPVDEGDRLGTLVLPGSHCFPRTCLHWGWLRGETYLDPLLLVGAGPVRLLPLGGLPVSPLPPPLASAAASPPVAAPYVRWEPLARVLDLAPPPG